MDLSDLRAVGLSTLLGFFGSHLGGLALNLIQLVQPAAQVFPLLGV